MQHKIPHARIFITVKAFFSVGLHITGNTSTHECKPYRANQVGGEVSIFYKLADVSEDKIYIVDRKKSTAILTAL